MEELPHRLQSQEGMRFFHLPRTFRFQTSVHGSILHFLPARFFTPERQDTKQIQPSPGAN